MWHVPSWPRGREDPHHRWRALLRRHLERLIAQLAALRTPDGRLLDLTLTTNGSLLARKAQLLKDAGLQRASPSASTGWTMPSSSA